MEITMKFSRQRILKLIDKIQRSGLSPKAYFQAHASQASFRALRISVAQYYRYLTRYQRDGDNGGAS
jgi:hypothetical protein